MNSTDNAQPSDLTVLAIEDNPANLRIIKRWMDRFGFTLFTATDGGIGLSEALRLQPDVILLDMGMPVMDGWEVARRLRADPAGKSLFIIAVTAHAMARDRQRCFEAGCNLFFSKPVNFRQLGEAILEHCSSRGSS
ncbi:MAG: response regulator [Myxococcota bacterium]|nr:response regulator [Myxococcota bacterium]